MLVYACDAAEAEPDNDNFDLTINWTRPASGVELAWVALPESVASGNGALLVLARFSQPEQKKVSLCMASHTGKALAPAAWSAQENLRAGINASMYLQDMLTSNGYMRDGQKVNNPRIGSRMGAFFVAAPHKAGLLPVDILERSQAGWRERLEDYSLVIQNFRLTDGSGRILWEDKQSAHSIAVVAKDAQDRLVFILCQEPLPVTQFVAYLSRLDLSLRSLMYVEGGRQASLFLRLTRDEMSKNAVPPQGATAHALEDSVIFVWRGRQSIFKIPGSPDHVLPNILGIRMPDPDEHPVY